MTVESLVAVPEAATVEPDSKAAKPRRPGAFTSENAGLMGKRGQMMQRLRAELEEERAKPRLLADLGPSEVLNNRLALGIVGEIERVMIDLAKPKLKPSERCQLIGALDRLMDRLRVLQGTPLPGSSRPQAPKAAGRADLVAEPIAVRQDRDGQD